MAILNIALGILCGSILGSKQVGSLCGALLTNLSAWLSGVWFDLKLVGGFFEKLAYALPFVHAVELERALIAGNVSAARNHLYPVCGYAVLTTLILMISIVLQMR